MNEQEKQALIEHAKENVKALKMASRQSAFKEVKGSIEKDLKLAEIALAAMTAEPIYQLINDGNWYDAEKHIYDEAVERGDVARIVFRSATPAVNLADLVPSKDAIRSEAAGYGSVYSLCEKEIFIEGGKWTRAEILRRIEGAGKC